LSDFPGTDGQFESGPETGPDPAWTDRSVLEGVRRREPEALGRFFDTAFPYVYSLAVRLTGNRHAAEDATQEVFLKVYQAADRLDPGRHPRPWITTITYNTCREAARRGASRAAESLDDGAGREPVASDRTPEQTSLSREQQRLLERALGELDGESRAIVLLRAYGDLSHERIAEIMNTSHSAVRKRFSRAIRRLSQLLRGTDA
jgi:RNA polymerase sigma-70 factor (ECF subfamily)